MIKELRCVFQNRGDTFEVEVKARALSLIRNLIESGE